MLSSIPPAINTPIPHRIKVACDDDLQTFEYLRNEYLQVESILIRPRVGSVGCRNRLSREVEDGLLYATDDIIFKPGSISAAFKLFNETFGDEDGVVGFVQDVKFHPTGVALVGQKFLQRFPEKVLFFPGYFHFACSEILELCNRLGGKFIVCQEARVQHLHPNYFKEQMDETHQEAREFRKGDTETKCYRKNKGLIWGSN
jgi:hypothetical protein